MLRAIDNIADYPAAIASFESHPLRKTASRAAALSGNLAANVLILCDKPRNDEDKSGDVLAGNNRVLAEKMLAAIGLSAFDESADNAVALAYLIPWRPPGNRAPTGTGGPDDGALRAEAGGAVAAQGHFVFWPFAGPVHGQW